MSRMVGTVSMGIRAPIIRSGDDLVEIVTNSVLETVKDGALTIRDRDVIAMTEAIVARAQGNYASVDDIAADVRAKLGGETVGVLFPILSRNRFAICLRGIAKGARKVVLMLSYPSDEVGNHLIDVDAMDEKGVDPYKDVLTLERYRELFGYTVHPFTGVDYVDYYSNLIRESGAEVEVIFANDPRAILPYTKNVLACDIHTRKRTKRLLKAAWVLELVVAVLILAVTLLELFLLGEGTLSQVLGGSFSADAFFADAMTIVVGIEFVKMLMLHTPRAVTDVLLFAIARQLVVNHSSAVDTLLGVAAVALIFVIKKFLHTDGDDAPAGDGRP